MRSWRPILFAFLIVVACSDDAQEPVLQLAAQHAGGQPGWEWSNPKPQGNELNDVSCHENVGFAVGPFGTIVRTLNGGLNWELQKSGTTDRLFGVAAIGATSAVVVGANGTILRTINRGATWERRQSGVTAALLDVDFADANHGIAVGHQVILRTEDAGITWISVKLAWLPPDFEGAIDFTRVCMVDANHAFAVGGSRVYATLDGGATWVEQPAYFGSQLFGVFFTDANTGTVVGERGFIARTKDGGTTWRQQNSDTRASLRGVSFLGADHGVAVGGITTDVGPVVLRTSDGGETWTHDYSRVPVAHVLPEFQAVTMLNASTVVTVGFAGNILRSTDGGRTWEDRTQTPVGFRLFNVSFADVNHGVAVGFGDILQTTDGGATWQRRSDEVSLLWDVAYATPTTVVAVGTHYLPPGDAIVVRSTDAGATWTTMSVYSAGPRAVDFADASIGTIAGGGGGILRTVDGGATWSPQESGTLEQLNGVAMLSVGIVLAVGAKGTIVRTVDGGALWHVQPHPDLIDDLNAVDFGDSETGFIVGGDRTILRTRDGGLTWTSLDSGTNERGFIDVACVDRKSAAILTPHTVLVTTDGGDHWTPSEPFNALTRPWAIAASGRKTVTMVGEFGVILQNQHIFP